MADPDVVVLGGGPAGACAARLLATWGHAIHLVTRPSSPGPRLAESIPPSAHKLFGLLGVLPALDAAGFVRSTGNTVWWGRATSRCEVFADGARGWQVTADRLESLLLDAARASGVRVEHEHASLDAPRADDAAFLLDCTGRSGVMARAHGLRVLEPAHRTIALAGVWQFTAPSAVPDPSHTLIESYEDGWAWSVPTSPDQRHVTVMVDPRTSGLVRDRGARAVYLEELRKTERFQALLNREALIEGPSGWDASMYSASEYVADDVLLVGDAGSFIDPLSSAGVKKALASGWLAAVTVHTALVRPEMRSTAVAFYAAREREVYAAFKTMTERYLAEAAGGHDHPFWNDRTDREASAAPGDSSADGMSSVQAAFERIRTADRLTLVRASHVHLEPRAAISGCEIVLEDRLVTDEDPVGVRYAYDVDLIGLLDLATAHDDVPTVFAAYNRRNAPVALPDFLAALATLVARRWLVWTE